MKETVKFGENVVVHAVGGNEENYFVSGDRSGARKCTTWRSIAQNLIQFLLGIKVVDHILGASQD
jgi:hypothetical protein